MTEPDRGPERLGDILGKLFTSRGWGRKNDRLRLESAWVAAAGESFVGETRVLGMKRGVLEVEVRTAVLMQELSHYHKRSILGKLRTALVGMTLTDIKFRAGVW